MYLLKVSVINLVEAICRRLFDNGLFADLHFTEHITYSRA